MAQIYSMPPAIPMAKILIMPFSFWAFSRHKDVLLPFHCRHPHSQYPRVRGKGLLCWIKPALRVGQKQKSDTKESSPREVALLLSFARAKVHRSSSGHHISARTWRSPGRSRGKQDEERMEGKRLWGLQSLSLTWFKTQHLVHVPLTSEGGTVNSLSQRFTVVRFNSGSSPQQLFFPHRSLLIHMLSTGARCSTPSPPRSLRTDWVKLRKILRQAMNMKDGKRIQFHD